MKNIDEQVITAIKDKHDELNRLKYGEISLIIQDGRVIRMELKSSIKIETDSKNERSRL